jgi:small GTP-binding protein
MSAFKTVLLGDGGVGKTAIIQRVSTGIFQPNIAPTVGATFTGVSHDTPDGTVKFQVWDTAGQEKFRELVPLYFRNAVIALVVFDLTSRASFDNVDEWVRTLRGVTPECVVGLIGNKCDLADLRAVAEEDGEALAGRCGAVFYTETSALTGEGIEPLFPRIHESLTARATAVPDTAVVALDAPPGAQAGRGYC